MIQEINSWEFAYIWHFQRIGINATNLKKGEFILKVMFSLASPSSMLKLPNDVGSHPFHFKYPLQNLNTEPLPKCKKLGHQHRLNWGHTSFFNSHTMHCFAYPHFTAVLTFRNDNWLGDTVTYRVPKEWARNNNNNNNNNNNFIRIKTVFDHWKIQQIRAGLFKAG